VSKRYTHDTIRPISYYGGEKKVDLGFVGSCMVHKGDMKIVAQMLKNLEKANTARSSSRRRWSWPRRPTTSSTS
jgi:aconitase B